MIKTKTPTMFAILVSVLFLLPPATGSAFTATNASADCYLMVRPYVREFWDAESSFPCSVRLDIDFEGHGCEHDHCSYTLTTTTTGTSAIPSWLIVTTDIFFGSGLFVCAGIYPERTVTSGLVPCESRVCDHGRVGKQVSCTSTLEIVEVIEPGHCSFFIVTSFLLRNRGNEYAATGLVPRVCHADGGSLEFRGD